MSFRLLATALLFAPATLLAAADCPAPVGSLELAAVVNQALCRHPDSRSAWLAVQTQQSRVDAARASRYPTLDAQLAQNHSFGAAGSADTTSARLSANWLLYDFGGRRATIAQSSQTLLALEASQEGSSQRIIQQAIDAYYAWYSADEALIAARAAADAAQETLKAAETRQKVGAGTLAEVLQARTAHAQAALRVIQREGEREIASANVAVAMGLSPPASVTLLPPANALPAQLQPPPFDELANKLDERRPDLRAQKHSLEAAKSSQEITAAQDRPSLSLSASDGVSRTSGSGTGFRESGNVGLTLSVPLFAGGRYQAQEIIAENQLSQAQTDYERLQLSARNELWIAWQNVRTQAATVEASKALLASASEAHRAALARYKAGLGTLLDVLSAQSTLADARQQEATTRYNWRRARLTLIQASGALNTAALDTGITP
jgi:outer membrane protein